MRSRLAPYFVRGFALLPVIYASGPDKWKGNTTVFIVILAALITGAELLRALVHGTEKSAHASAFQTIGYIISRLAGSTIRSGAPSIAHDPGETIETLLRRGKDVVASGLKPAIGDRITASLLLPVASSRGKVSGLQATQHDDFYPDRAHQLVPLDAPGVGEAFSTGAWRVVEDMEEETSGRYSDRPYRSVAAFPILVELAEGKCCNFRFDTSVYIYATIGPAAGPVRASHRAADRARSRTPQPGEMLMQQPPVSRERTPRPLDAYVPVDRSQLPHVEIVPKHPTLGEILIMGWQYFLPSLDRKR
jgi:hypothetical protein